MTVLRPEGWKPSDDEVAERKPGDFARHRTTGAPYVNHPTEHKKGWPGNKAELIELCAKRGLELPEKVTIPQLQALLGPCPKRVQYGRPSSLGGQIENKTAIQKWAERGVALGAWIGNDRMYDSLREFPEDRLTLRDPDTRTVLDGIAAAAKHAAGCDLAADRGTFVHKLLEQVDRG
jgi:hypothetical protein